MKRRILVSLLKHLGDTVLALPALKLLKEADPLAETTLLAKGGAAELVHGHPWVDRVIRVDYQRPGFRARELVRALKGHDLYLAFDYRFRPLLWTLLAGIKERWGAPEIYDSRPAWWGRVGFNRRLELPRDESENQSISFQRLVSQAFGLPIRPELRPAAPSLPGETVRRAAERLKPLAGRPLKIGLGLRGRQPEKTWPPYQAAQLMAWLRNRLHAGLFTLGAADEAAYSQAVIELSGGPALNLCGQTGVLEAVALMDQADLFISVDTGLAHLGALTQTPLIVIFIWTNPLKWSPRSPNARVMAYDWALRRFGLPPRPEITSAAEITPAMVWEMVLRQLGRS